MLAFSLRGSRYRGQFRFHPCLPLGIKFLVSAPDFHQHIIAEEAKIAPAAAVAPLSARQLALRPAHWIMNEF